MTLSPTSQQKIAVVVPVYLGEDTIIELTKRVGSVLNKISSNWQLVLVDDCSPDGSWPVIQKLAEQDPRVLGLRLSRNFGQHQAITAGLYHTQANWYVVMDCDLQDQPEAILDLYAAVQREECDIAIAVRDQSGLGVRRSITSKLFNWLLSWLSGLPVSDRIGNFRMLSERAMRAYRHYPEQMRLFTVLSAEIGFTSTRVPVGRARRVEGKSTYTFFKLFALAIDTTIAYSDRALRILAGFGIGLALLAFIYLIWVVVATILGTVDLLGWASTIAVILSLGGLQLFTLCLIGLYVGQVYRESKRRPVYIVESSTRVGISVPPADRIEIGVNEFPSHFLPPDRG